MLSLHNVHAGYGEKLVLHDATLEIADGEFVGLVGPNGCGKTTLLRVISGVLTATTGDIRLLNRDLGTFDRRELARTVALLPQELSLDLAFTVGEVALMGRFAHQTRFGRETEADRAAARRAMEMAEVIHLADRPVTELSGGERQRAFIALCLAQEPKLLLLDEPNNHLDIGHQLSILNLIAGLNREAGLTVMATFHDLNLAAEYCDRLIVIDAGRIIAIGPPSEVLTPERIHQIYGVEVWSSGTPYQASRTSYMLHRVVRSAAFRRNFSQRNRLKPELQTIATTGNQFMQPKFLYFDLGKVLVDFSVDRMLRQIGHVAEIAPEAVRTALFDGDLWRRLESGRLSSREFYEAFCNATGTRSDPDALAAAAAEIFSLNLPVLPIAAQLRQAGCAMGILSNTCEIHWRHCFDHYRIVAEGFSVHALSYEIGAVKPDPAIYRAAAELAGHRPEEIFFVDDIAGHVAGARAAGFDAVQFTTADALAAELRRRGIRFNY